MKASSHQINLYFLRLTMKKTINKPQLTMGIIASLGMIETGFLTLAKWLGRGDIVCPTEGCHSVLDSRYGTLFGQPLTLYGFLAYFTVTVLIFTPSLYQQLQSKKLSVTWEDNLWFGLLIVTGIMTFTSGYLMYIMVGELQATCYYCIASALFSLSLFLLTLFGTIWEDIGQVIFTTFLVGIITVVSLTGVYAESSSPEISLGVAPEITTVSSAESIMTAQELKAIGAKIYTAYTCPHCHQQKEILGKEAFALIENIECHPNGVNAQPEKCSRAGIKGVPTWEIQGKFYEGIQSLEDLRNILKG